MYYPFFRGKQFELILLREQAEFLRQHKICPIIEPVKLNVSQLKRCLDNLKDASASFILVCNPQVGEFDNKNRNILNAVIDDKLIDQKNVSLGYIVHGATKPSTVAKTIESWGDIPFTIIHKGYEEGKKFSEILDQFDNIESHVFIDRFSGKLYQKHFKKDGIKRILIRDGFISRKNALYPKSEHFSDLHITFEEEGMDGFGDFSIVGEEYRPEGGPAHAIAIHLTYLDSEGDMFIHHFISDRKTSPTDPGGKFGEALDKLVKNANSKGTSIFPSKAVNEYIELHEKEHFPGLGYAKKLSMQHHLELVANFLQ